MVVEKLLNHRKMTARDGPMEGRPSEATSKLVVCSIGKKQTNKLDISDESGPEQRDSIAVYLEDWSLLPSEREYGKRQDGL